SCPRWSTSPTAVGLTGSSPSLAASSAATTTSSPRSSVTGSASSPILTFGPWRSAITAIGRPTSSATSRTWPAHLAWSSCVPCEKFSRATFMPARASSRTLSREDDAGPSVATIFVRRGSSADMRLRLALRQAGESVPAGIHGFGAELFLDPEQLVVLRDTVAPRRGARLDLARIGCDGQVRDRRVLGLPGAVRHDHAVAGRTGERDGVERF